jgi:hypothetical protein
LPQRRDLLEERFLALLSTIENAFQSLFGISPYITFGTSLNSEMFAILRSGIPEAVPAHLSDHYSMLRFKGEIIKEMTKSPVEELQLSQKELEKECVKERLLKIGGEIEKLEKSGNHGGVTSLLDDFKKLSFHLKTLT